MRLFPRHGHTLALVSWDSFLDSLYEMCPSQFCWFGVVGLWSGGSWPPDCWKVPFWRSSKSSLCTTAYVGISDTTSCPNFSVP